MNDTNYIAYLILRNQYTQNNENVTKDKMQNYIKYFPENWEIDYTLEEKIQLLSEAIKNNKTLIEILNQKRDKRKY